MGCVVAGYIGFLDAELEISKHGRKNVKFHPFTGDNTATLSHQLF